MRNLDQSYCSTCPTKCCNSANQCAADASDCKLFDIGQKCGNNSDCQSSCCNQNVCQQGSECKFKELGMVSFFAVFILTSIILLTIGLYFHAKRKKRQALARRNRGPRIREIIAEGEITNDPKPPIHTISIAESGGEVSSDSKQDIKRPHLKRPDPVKTSSDGFDRVVWRTRANSRHTRQTMQQTSPMIPSLQSTTQPQELSNYDPYLQTRSSPLRRPMDEAREISPDTINLDNVVGNEAIRPENENVYRTEEDEEYV